MAGSKVSLDGGHQHPIDKDLHMPTGRKTIALVITGGEGMRL